MTQERCKLRLKLGRTEFRDTYDLSFKWAMLMAIANFLNGFVLILSLGRISTNASLEVARAISIDRLKRRDNNDKYSQRS